MARSSVSSARPAQPAPAGEYVVDRSLAANLLISLRPTQWTKNLVVFAGLIFGEELLVPGSVALASLAFAVFCVLSGVVYLFNDVRDRDADRLHPIKSARRAPCPCPPPRPRPPCWPPARWARRSGSALPSAW
jgi:hypothetical protein